MDNNIIFVLGAGATYSEGVSNAARNLPPLDKKFFSNASESFPDLCEKVHTYFKKNYHKDLYDSRYDSFEQIMSTIYTDLFEPSLKHEASHAFVSLIELFNKKLASSTNPILCNYQRQLYRIMVNLFNHGYEPDNITFITFNQDIQIERTLDFLNKQRKWKHLELFSFPRCYCLNMAAIPTTVPKNTKRYFEEPDDLPAKILVLKLHGSLNWYTPLEKEEFDPDEFFDLSRKLQITKRKVIDPKMKYANQSTLPIVIPPVNNKSAIMNNQLRYVWQEAELKLKNANEIVFWGYSLPELDFESRNLFFRNIIDNTKIRNIVVIDPDSSVAKKYIDLLNLNKLEYFNHANSFIKDFFNR